MAAWHLLWDLHPQNQLQFQMQKAIGGVFAPYRDWMTGRAIDEINNQNMDKLGLTWSDIKSPWASSLSGGNAAQAVGNAMARVSSNVADLYRNSRPDDYGPALGESMKAYKKKKAIVNRRRSMGYR